ncbi:salivary glue protein Sgs-3-like [Dreissena polymorpha]|uniref:C-type lectin domain-containing protein n=1 Tax=Dreissena polymorpha TaxID=45954 RepID=A0A9D4H7S4_DREPO|nr:salivary glue protein Sgs-3-like [Dreissena polymorpha]KAH3828479.1 hypothetical protein DPMN_130454 [Dreissena polymorpha]
MQMYPSTILEETADLKSMTTNDIPSSTQIYLITNSTTTLSNTETISPSVFPAYSQYMNKSTPASFKVNISDTTAVRIITTIGSTPPNTTTKVLSTSATTTIPTTTTPLAGNMAVLEPATSVPKEGHVDLCPDYVKADANLFGGYLGKYGEQCLELVKIQTQWHNAQRHCQVAGHGNLIDIHDPRKQDYVVRFLEKHTDVHSIWLGLTDSEKEGAPSEGRWTCVSGLN